MLQWLGGPVTEVACFTGTPARAIEMEDSGVMAFRMQSGAMGSINVTMLTYPKNLEGSVTVIGHERTGPDLQTAVRTKPPDSVA